MNTSGIVKNPALVKVPSKDRLIETSESPIRIDDKIKSPIAVTEKNLEIIDKNNNKKKKTILSNLYRIDDRTINFHQAKQGLFNLTTFYLAKHQEKQANSRDMVQNIEEREWKRKKMALDKGLELTSTHSEDKYYYMEA